MEYTRNVPRKVKGRYAPSPTGRMHLGNAFAALASWLSAKSAGGEWLLRIEDLDPQRSRLDYAFRIEDDLHWLGLDWDEGGVSGEGAAGPYLQSERGEVYARMAERLQKAGITYRCRCSRSEIMATQAPHESDGRVIYAGTCRPVSLGGTVPDPGYQEGSLRLCVPDREIHFRDLLYGSQSVNLASHCGDFLIRRADGAWAYQLAVVADDALMGVTEVVRGSDLLLSSAQQIFLYQKLGYAVPQFGHIPLLCDADGLRFSKRHGSVDLGVLRARLTSREVIGRLGHLLGLIPEPQPCLPRDLVPLFSWEALSKRFGNNPRICLDPAAF